MKTITPKRNESALKILSRCGGYYTQTNCDEPLVGYAATYESPHGPLQYVGKTYANFAKAEEHGPVLGHFAETLLDKIGGIYSHPELYKVWQDSTGFCGLPMGGLGIGTTLSVLGKKQYIFPEKKVTQLKTPALREQSSLVWGRHEPQKGGKYWAAEDVCNNFSTVEELITLFESAGAELCGIVCLLNRSGSVTDTFVSNSGLKLPVVSVVTMPIPQWKQDHPEVADQIACGNIVLKPKTDWDERIAPFLANC